MRRSSLLLSITVLAAAVACDPNTETGSAPSSGIRVSEEDLCNFRYGTTTSSDVRRVLGEPQGSSSTADGNLLFVYLFTQPAAGVIEQVGFQFRMDVLQLVQRSQVGTPHRAPPACLGPQPETLPFDNR
jgi:hypothetical protein